MKPRDAPLQHNLQYILMFSVFIVMRHNLRLILIGERFFQNFQSLEIIGDMYQCTEAFCHYS